jgi:hypothetical protein
MFAQDVSVEFLLVAWWLGGLVAWWLGDDLASKPDDLRLGGLIGVRCHDVGLLSRVTQTQTAKHT